MDARGRLWSSSSSPCGISFACSNDRRAGGFAYHASTVCSGLGSRESGPVGVRRSSSSHLTPSSPASARIPSVLGVEEPPQDGSADARSRRPRTDSRDGRYQSALGAPRIHGELLKLGFTIAQTTVAKHMDRRRPRPSQTWRTFLANHAHQLIAADFFVVPTATYRLLFVLVLLAHDRRRIVHVAVTDHPTAA